MLIILIVFLFFMSNFINSITILSYFYSYVYWKDRVLFKSFKILIFFLIRVLFFIFADYLIFLKFGLFCSFWKFGNSLTLCTIELLLSSSWSASFLKLFNNSSLFSTTFMIQSKAYKIYLLYKAITGKN